MLKIDWAKLYFSNGDNDDNTKKWVKTLKKVFGHYETFTLQITLSDHLVLLWLCKT